MVVGLAGCCEQLEGSCPELLILKFESSEFLIFVTKFSHPFLFQYENTFFQFLNLEVELYHILVVDLACVYDL